jgi:hypothetical protein
MKKGLKENIVLSVGRTLGVTKKQIELYLETGDPTSLKSESAAAGKKADE